MTNMNPLSFNSKTLGIVMLQLKITHHVTYEYLSSRRDISCQMRVKVKETLAWLYLCSPFGGHTNAVPTAQIIGKLRKNMREMRCQMHLREKSQ